MAINPNTAFGGRITAPDASYPYGSSKNETSPGAGDGTPYEKIRADDIFGLQQALLSEAGIVPSGSADTVLDSQYKEGMRAIFNMRNVTHNTASDANYTLTAEQNTFRRINITDTGVVLTAARDIIVDDSERRFIAINSTAQELTFRTLSGTGIAVPASESADLVCDGTDVVGAPGAGLDISSTAQAQAGTDNTTAISPLRLHEAMLGSASQQAYVDVTASRTHSVVYTNTTGRPILVIILALSTVTREIVTGAGVVIGYIQGISQVAENSFIVPDGETYEIAGTVSSILYWSELR